MQPDTETQPDMVDEVELDDELLPDVLPPAYQPVHGVLLVEGSETGDYPRREFAPGSVTWASLPLPLKWQPAEDDAHDGAMISGRMDEIWRDGALIRWRGVMDMGGAPGIEATRLISEHFLRGVSILADDIEDTDIELEYGVAIPLDDDPNVLPDDEADMATDAAADPGMVEMVVAPVRKEIMHAGRIRSATLVPEAAFVESFVELGEGPLNPGAPEAVEVAEVLESGPADEMTPTTVTAAAYIITIPQVWPESWFQEPTREEMAMVAGGAVQITPEGRVWGLIAPGGVDHRGFRGSGRRVQAPRGIDYSEWQNKMCLVAGADGGVYRINAGTVTFGCGHASPVDPRRADPTWAAEHYENSCSVAMRARAGENRYGTWFAGGLAHGLTADALEQVMGCALSGDWQGGKLKAALLVPVEGFPTAVTASVRERMGSLVASSVPIHYIPPPPEPDMGFLFDLVASATGRGPDARFAELAEERFTELASGRG